MKSWFLQALFDIRYSYWFIPSLMALGSVCLAGAMVYLDIYVLTEIPKGYEWFFRSQPSGARAILSTVAGSTITVAGVIFSMTIMSVSHSTANYGSRLLLQFLKDRRNQIALGTFIATFIYCLLVLRTVSSAESGNEYAGFVPHLAVLGALGMALASVAVLIAFIHHVPDSIHIGKVAADRGRELSTRLEDLFPPADDSFDGSLAFIDQPAAVSVDLPRQVKSTKSGYLQALDVQGLVKFCAKNNVVVQILKSAGDFIYAGEPIFKFDASEGEFEKLDEFQDFLGIGSERTPAQDTRFLIEELTQISIRALSPGINDPFTAITCMDWLANAVTHVVARPARMFALYDEQEELRLILPAFSFEDLCTAIFLELRPYVTNNLTTSIYIAKVFNNIAACTENSERRKIILDYAKSYAAEAKVFCPSEREQERLDEAFSYVL